MPMQDLGAQIAEASGDTSDADPTTEASEEEQAEPEQHAEPEELNAQSWLSASDIHRNRLLAEDKDCWSGAKASGATKK